MIANLFGLIIELGCFYTVMNMDKMPFLNFIFTRGLLVYYLIYILLFSAYVFIISHDVKKQSEEYNKKYYKKVLSFCVVYFIICSILVIVLPLQYYNSNNKVYSYGMAVDFLFIAYSILPWAIFTFALDR